MATKPTIKQGELNLRIVGKKGNLKLGPETYDITELRQVLAAVEDLLYPLHKKERPIISYNIKEGSVRHIFTTGVQALISFTAVLAEIETAKSIDFLELRSALAIEQIQKTAYEKNYDFEIYTSQKGSPRLKITPATSFIRSENIWVESELYFYGELTNAGGKKRANMHLNVPGVGVVIIDTPKDILEKLEQNPLYKHLGIRAMGRQNIATGEIDRHKLKYVEFVDYSAKFDESYLDGLISKAEKHWQGMDADKWLRDLRGNFA